MALVPREEVRKHAVRWNAEFSFVCKMCANANTGVLERALMRVSVRKECKGKLRHLQVGSRLYEDHDTRDRQQFTAASPN
ncbi:jg3085 [Pararge aegeria aegeria]|uniref:Jg3085 protein n=1 Tax=Pararge aegeria aegeria TaxID=348720 RepID=A0A8S4QY97_9NEOP|nr:jg3085 [Pararge aegeria aegeria]